MHRKVMFVSLAVLALISSAWAMTEQERIEYRNHLLEILPEVPTWRQWLTDSRELPPDFDALPKQNSLPDPLKFVDGKEVKTPAEWPARRAQILELFQKYDIGTIPPAPKIDSVDVVSEATADGVTTRVVTLHYGPDSQLSLRVTVGIPDGAGPFPVLIEGEGFGRTGPNPAVLRRSYISCVYPNSVDSAANSAQMRQLFPNYDFGTMGQVAWTTQAVVDYLYTLPQVDKSRIAITGYSRLGKMATIAAAYDERIAAVIAGSTGVGGVVPWRLGGERNQAESIQSTTLMFPLWFTPRLRYFAGREDRLPIDGNLLVAALAPRACLIEYGLNDEVSNDFASEAVLQNVEPVYKMLGKPDAVGLLRLPGTHGANNLELCLDWLDIQFGRSTAKWDNHPLFAWDFNQWREKQEPAFNLASFPAHQPDDLLVSASGQPITTTAAWDAKAAELRKSIDWMLGDATPVNESVAVSINPLEGIPPAPARGAGPGRGAAGRGPTPPTFQIGSSVQPPVAALVLRSSGELGWLAPERETASVRTLTFGDNLKGDLYYPTNTPAGTKLPTVIWLHGYSYPLGYMWVYKRDLHPILSLVGAGYAVFAYDQSGFGGRMGEFAHFYDRYPRWSQMGRLVDDARQAITALQKDEAVDGNNIGLYGYELGGSVALYTAALDSRVKSVVSICGFTPMRTDTSDKGTGGLARFSMDRGILPRLGLFIGHEAQLPYDYQDVLALIAPRAALVVAPQMDRDATPGEVNAAVTQARKVYALYGAADKLVLDEPWDYARLPTPTLNYIVNWLAKVSPSPATPPPATPAVALSP